MKTDKLAKLKPLPNGNYPALQYARASLARSIITDRYERGWSQAELARRAGIQPAVLNRIEKARVSADVATVEKIEKALGEGRNQRVQM